MKTLSFILTSLSLTLALPVGAVRAIDQYIDFSQPDGTVLKVKKYGDEFSHFSVTTGDVLLAEVGDSYYFGKIDKDGNVISTGVPANETSRNLLAMNKGLTVVTPEMATIIYKNNLSCSHMQASCSKGMIPQSGMGRFRTNFPTEGDIKSVVILVSYQDVDFNLEDPYEYFNGLLNIDGYSEYDATGCVAEYFRFNSDGRFRPEFTVLGPVKLPYPRSYYGQNGPSDNDRNAHQMVIHAVEQLDPEIDFSQFDMDHNGIVDNIYIIYAGQGEATGGPASSVWPHSWGLSYAGVELEADGVKIDGYGCSNEWLDNRPDGMGTFTHEFSHVVGLPDLYSTNYGNSIYATPGAWSVMDYGPYLNNGHTPPNYSSYERLAFGWIDPKLLTGPDNVVLDNLADSNQACIIQSSNEAEYYLFENRQQTGWDRFLPASGMLIWHVDYVKNIFENNQLNNERRHMHVELMKANNISDDTYDGVIEGWCWPGSAAKHEFTDDTEPSMITWTGERLNLPITDIEHSDGLISFKVAEGRDPILAPVVLTPENEGEGWFEARWKPSLNATDYLLTVLEQRRFEPDVLERNDMGNEAGFLLPEGWTSSASTIYSTSGNYGESAPSYKMGSDNCNISSPVYDKDVSCISFWYKGINCDGALEVSGLNEKGEMVDIASFLPAKQGGRTEVIEDLPEGIRQVIFTFRKNTGNIALDDIELTLSGSENTPLAGYQRVSTAGETALRVEYSPAPDTSYLYYVEATDGEFISKPSEKMTVKGWGSGIMEVKAGKLNFHLEGKTLTAEGKCDIIDMTGRLLCRNCASYTFASPGLYLLRHGRTVTKIVVR